MKSNLAAFAVVPLALTTHAAAANTPPTVIIKSATMRGATGLMDVVFRVNDPDDATVKTRALAFIDGQRSFAKVIKPTTFAEGTESKLGEAIASNTDHTLTWNVAADWNISLGQIKFEILAMDTRGLLPLDWVTIPAANGQPELTISKNAPTDQQTLDALFWQYASRDPGLVLENDELRGSAASEAFSRIQLAKNGNASMFGPSYVYSRMNLRSAGGEEVDRSLAARASHQQSSRWRATPDSYQYPDAVTTWGFSEFNITIPPKSLNGIKQISSGAYHTLALRFDGSLVSWGDNSSGQTNIPTSLLSCTSVAAGRVHSLAIQSDGTVSAWGDNSYGQSSVPTGLSGVLKVAAGFGHSLALKNDGTVVGWGYNISGQCNVPNDLTEVVDIAAGQLHSAALKRDGSVIVWGSRNNGVQDKPFDLTGVISISSTYDHILALKIDGSVIAWGLNDYGQCTIPNGLSNVTMISAGIFHSLALKSDGTVVGWGSNDEGQTTIPSELSNIAATSVAAGYWHSVAVGLKAP